MCVEWVGVSVNQVYVWAGGQCESSVCGGGGRLRTVHVKEPKQAIQYIVYYW